MWKLLLQHSLKKKKNLMNEDILTVLACNKLNMTLGSVLSVWDFSEMSCLITQAKHRTMPLLI